MLNLLLSFCFSSLYTWKIARLPYKIDYSNLPKMKFVDYYFYLQKEFKPYSEKFYNND